MLNRLTFFLIGFIFFLKIFAISFTNFDLFGDEAQYWLWSQTIDLGYYSKPPLLAWVVGVITYVFGSGFVVLKLIPFAMYIFSAYLVCLVSYQLYKNKNLAIISAISFYLMPGVSVSSFILSTDVFLIFFWLLCLFVLLKIRNKPHLINFLMLGVFLGLAFLTKYAAVYFLLSLFLFLFLDTRLRGVFFEKTLYVFLFIITFIIVLLPNIIWNIKNNWITISHTSDNAALDRININLLQGIEFFFIQTAMIGPLLFLLFFITINKIQFSFQTKFLLCFSLPVFLIVLIESVLVRANANWAAVALPALLIFLAHHGNKHFKRTVYISNFINAVFCCFLFFLILTSSSLKVFNRINGISVFATNLEENYLSDTDILVVEDRLLFSNLSYLYRDSKKTLLTPFNPTSDVKSSFHLSNPLNPLFSRKFIFVGSPASINYLTKKNVAIKKEVGSFVFKKEPIEIYEITF